ncbi:hypothetical protein A9Q88_12975 [Gammaproteobacteria bacterium 50_400_T64]|nr:hypothetical protein A9Q88_12975 [Gammaproteobacteria bacterium 50_400_T64]
MSEITFLYPEKTVNLEAFIAAWIGYCQHQFSCAGHDWVEFEMPILGSNATLTDIDPGLDRLARILGGNRDTRQISNEFFEINNEFIERSDSGINPKTGRQVNAAKLTPSAIACWNNFSGNPRNHD